jgi:two-component system NtrC family sensor kinase
MKLRTNLFLWIFPAIALPVTGLMLFTMAHGDKVLRQDIDREIFSSLNSIAVALNSRLHVEQDLLRGLSTQHVVREFLPVLAGLDKGVMPPDYSERADALASSLESFQSVRLSLNTVRILDTAGNTHVMVRSGRRVPAQLESLGEVPYVEEAPDDAGFQRALRELAPADVGAIVLPEDYYASSGYAGRIPVMNTITPLVYRGGVVGYFTVDAPLPQFNSILSVAQRPYGGELMVTETDSPLPGREGLVLYDDLDGVTLIAGYMAFAERETAVSRYTDIAYTGPTGVVDDGDGSNRVYFQEMLPYPGSLTTWVIAMRLDPESALAPFFTRNMAILYGVLIALLLSLLLAQAGSLQIAAPIRRLAACMAAYRQGITAKPVSVQGPDELRQAGEAFNLMVSNLEEAETKRNEAEVAMLQSAKLASIGQMAAGIGHEINNPLSNILSLTKLVERRLSGADRVLTQDVGSIREEAERVSRIVTAILNFGRQSKSVRTRFATRPWLLETLGLVDTEAANRHVNLVSEIKGDAELEGDRDLLQQALINLLLNAMHASPEGGTVKVASSISGDLLTLSVSDQGAGLAPEVAGNVFDPFFTTKPEGEGSGLGLSISLGIVQHHNGTLALSNNPEGGATATMTLPVS